MALELHSIVDLEKLFSLQIECIDAGPGKAITTIEAKPLQVDFFGVLPQVTLLFLALSFYSWGINVRMLTIMVFVEGGGIGFVLQLVDQPSSIKQSGHGVTYHNHRSHHARLPERKNQGPRSMNDLVAFSVWSEVVECCYELFSGLRDIFDLIGKQDILCR
jgi:hypothetical protein